MSATVSLILVVLLVLVIHVLRRLGRPRGGEEVPEFTNPHDDLSWRVERGTRVALAAARRVRQRDVPPSTDAEVEALLKDIQDLPTAHGQPEDDL